MLDKKLKIALFFLVMLIAAAVNAQGRELTFHNKNYVDVKIYFPYDEAYIDSTYMGNLATFRFIDSLLCDTAYIATLRKIEINAQSSPEGTVSYNTRLSERRRLTIQEYFTTKYPEIDSELWLFKAVPENWEEFRKNLTEDPNLPHKEEILSIVDSDKALDTKEWILREMNGGKPWAYIKEHILPIQRFGAGVLFIPSPSYPIKFASNVPTTIFEPTQPILPLNIPEFRLPEAKKPQIVFALKTNMVLDALSVVNLGVEIPIGKRISVVGEVVYPWWRSWPKDFTMQIESYHGEIKYWLGNRDIKEHLQGFYVGAYGGWGRYDIQPFSRTGVQGSFTDYGAEVGYAHPIARNLHLEYTVGLGYVSTKYEDYYIANNTDEFGDIKVIPYPWVLNKVKTILPTRIGVSLVWTIKSKGGVR